MTLIGRSCGGEYIPHVAGQHPKELRLARDKGELVMIPFNCIRMVLVTVASVILLAPAVAVAQGFPDRDAREISAYVLSEAALVKYTRASANLGSLSKQIASNCDDSDSPASLDASVARINAVPQAKAAIESAGMTPREYLVFSFSLFQSGMAAWALSQPGGTLPPGVSKANVDFYRSHEQALGKLAPQQGSDTCGDRNEAEEEPAEEEPTE